jgi:hypothetical protein
MGKQGSPLAAFWETPLRPASAIAGNTGGADYRRGEEAVALVWPKHPVGWRRGVVLSMSADWGGRRC